ncbi:MAG: thiamine pyrophosphate-binding protein [Acidimicrobiales bacterium]
MTLVEAVAAALAASGVEQAFGVVGSGNFHLTNALRDCGVRFVAARHEMGAAVMADAYTRLTRTPSVVTLHQGCGLTNALTGITEAAKSGSPMIVVTAEATNPHSNFFVDQMAMAGAAGAAAVRIDDPATAVADAAVAVARAVDERRTVVINLPLDAQTAIVPLDARTAPAVPRPEPVVPAADEVDALADLVRSADRPVFVAGRGCRAPGAGDAVARAAEAAGALLATSAVANGLYADHPWNLGISGGFASPAAARLIGDADLVVGWGCALNMWTTRHGALVAGAQVVQVDDRAGALGAQRRIDLGVVGDVTLTAAALAAALDAGPRSGAGYRQTATAAVLAAGIGWADQPSGETRAGPSAGADRADRIDPAVLSRALDDRLPAARVVAVDSGNFMGHPTAYLRVPDLDGYCLTQGFQSIGLGLSTAIGCAVARPDRLTVAALGDGGFLMGVAELETVRRLGLAMVIVIYDDDAYGAEVHHFGPDRHDLSTVTFPETDLAAVARGFGLEGVTVRRVEDLSPLDAWLAARRDGRARPAMVIDAKVTRAASWWLEEAFRGH